MAAKYTWSVFTKPWKMPLPELGKYVHSLGFDGIELPVRPGFQVEPGNVKTGLPEAVKILKDCGVAVCSIAGPTDPATIAACAESGVHIIRVCESTKPGAYLAEEARLQKQFDQLARVLDEYGVTLGIQNHCGHGVANAMQLRSLLGKFNPRNIGAVWDAAHNALNGEEPEDAIDIIYSHLCMLNLKNAYWKRKDNDKADHAEWKSYWCGGREGLASWPRVAAELKKRDWSGIICLTAEYSDDKAVDKLIVEDFQYAKSLFA
jgi:sugar phosphate isomerase/epimerase